MKKKPFGNNAVEAPLLSLRLLVFKYKTLDIHVIILIILNDTTKS